LAQRGRWRGGIGASVGPRTRCRWCRWRRWSEPGIEAQCASPLASPPLRPALARGRPPPSSCVPSPEEREGAAATPSSRSGLRRPRGRRVHGAAARPDDLPERRPHDRTRRNAREATMRAARRYVEPGAAPSSARLPAQSTLRSITRRCPEDRAPARRASLSRLCVTGQRLRFAEHTGELERLVREVAKDPAGDGPDGARVVAGPDRSSPGTARSSTMSTAPRCPAPRSASRGRATGASCSTSSVRAARATPNCFATSATRHRSRMGSGPASERGNASSARRPRSRGRRAPPAARHQVLVVDVRRLGYGRAELLPEALAFLVAHDGADQRVGRRCEDRRGRRTRGLGRRVHGWRRRHHGQ
jgi:hypothetical protein